jgi:hypothetical protein
MNGRKQGNRRGNRGREQGRESRLPKDRYPLTEVEARLDDIAYDILAGVRMNFSSKYEAGVRPYGPRRTDLFDQVPLVIAALYELWNKYVTEEKKTVMESAPTLLRNLGAVTVPPPAPSITLPDPHPTAQIPQITVPPVEASLKQDSQPPPEPKSPALNPGERLTL